MYRFEAVQQDLGGVFKFRVTYFGSLDYKKKKI
jgi:hypothetical protein